VGLSRGQLIGLCVTLAAALLFAAIPVKRLLDRDDWLTGARRVDWYGERGESLPRAFERPGYDARCTGDIRWRALIWGETVWTVCDKTPEHAEGGLARIDLGAGRGDLRWPIPAEHPWQWTEGLLPGPAGELAVVYHSERRLVAALAGPDGWLAGPEPLVGGTSRLLGVAAVDGDFEIALVPSSDEDPYAVWSAPVIATMAPGRSLAFRDVALETLCPDDAGFRSCHPKLAVRGESGWEFLIYTGEAPMPLISEDGRARQTGWDDAGFLADQELDATAAGKVVQNPLSVKARVGPDGVIARSDTAAPITGDASPFSGLYTVDDGVLRWRPEWYESRDDDDSTSISAFAQVVDGRTWIVEHRRPWPGPDGMMPRRDHVLALIDATDPDEPAENLVARVYGFSCGDLSRPAIVPRPAGGMWLAAGGCFVAIDEHGQRADPLALREHLRRRGSVGIDWNERRHVGFLVFAVGGLPVLVGLGAVAGLAHARQRARPRAPLAANYLIAACAVYAVLMTAILGRLLDVLR
jgi:hypothetical protein